MPKKSKTWIYAVLIALVVVIAVTLSFQLSAQQGHRHVIYPAGTRLYVYGLPPTLVSEYNIIVNVTANSTVEGAWSSPYFHVMPNVCLNNEGNDTNVVPIVNHTGPQIAFLILSHLPTASILPTRGSFSIRFTFGAGGNFRMSGYWTSVNGTAHINSGILYPRNVLKYGLLLSFVFLYPTSGSSVTTPFLNVTEDFVIVSTP